MGRGKNLTGVCRGNGDDAHVCGLGGMDSGDGIFKDDAILGFYIKCRGGLKVAIGFGFAALITSGIDDRGKIVADGESIENKIDVASGAASCDGAEDAGGVGFVEEFAQAGCEAHVGLVDFAIEDFLFVGHFLIVVCGEAWEHLFAIVACGGAHPIEDLFFCDGAAVAFGELEPSDDVVLRVADERAIHIEDVRAGGVRHK